MIIMKTAGERLEGHTNFQFGIMQTNATKELGTRSQGSCRTTKRMASDAGIVFVWYVKIADVTSQYTLAAHVERYL
jgi:hypothetical protein